jgi:hypothetical protein
VAVRCYSDTDMFRFWLPFVSAPQRLVPGSCVAARLWARVRFRGGDRLTLSPVECALRQRVYERQRAEWLLLVEAERRHASVRSWDGHMGVSDFKR